MTPTNTTAHAVRADEPIHTSLGHAGDTAPFALRAAHDDTRSALMNSTWALTSLVSLKSVLSSITREAATDLCLDDVAVYVYDRSADTLILSAAYPAAKSRPSGSAHGLDLSRCHGEWRVLSQPNVVVEQADDERLAADRRQAMHDLSQLTSLSVPLWVNEQPLGILRLADTRRHREFDRHELDTAATFGRHAATAIERSRLQTAVAAATRLLGVLTEVSRGLATADSIDEAMGRIMRGAVEALEASGADVYEYLPDENQIVVSWSRQLDDPAAAAAFVGTRYDLTENPTYRRAFQKERVVEYHLDDPGFRELDPGLCRQMQEWDEQSAIEVGILYEEEILGILSITSTRMLRYLSPLEIEVVLSLAALAATTIHAHRMRERTGDAGLIDPMTGLPNRTALVRRLRREVERAGNRDAPLSLIVCDIDDFKEFNQRFGDDAGDDALRRIAGLLVEDTRRNLDTGFRCSGDGFAIVLPDTPSQAAGKSVRRLVRRISAAEFAVGGEAVGLPKLSVGMAAFPDSAADARQLLQTAATAMHRARRRR